MRLRGILVVTLALAGLASRASGQDAGGEGVQPIGTTAAGPEKVGATSSVRQGRTSHERVAVEVVSDASVRGRTPGAPGAASLVESGLIQFLVARRVVVERDGRSRPDVVIRARTWGDEVLDVGGYGIFSARVGIYTELVDAASGEVIAAASAHGAGLSTFEQRARMLAVQAAVDSVGPPLLDILVRRQEDLLARSGTLLIEIVGLRYYSQLQSILSGFHAGNRTLRGAVPRTVDIPRGTATLEVPGGPDAFATAEVIQRQRFGSLRLTIERVHARRITARISSR